MRPRRSMIFMPGDSHRKIEKATTLDVDCIVMDLEDGVALSQKSEARQITRKACESLDFSRREKLVRVNPLRTEMTYDDLAHTIAGKPDGYVIPKVETPRELHDIDAILRQLEQLHDLPPQSIHVFALIESALGVMNLREIAQASPRLQALMFGAEDLAGDIGAQRTAEGWEVFYARSAVVTAAAAYHIDAIDTVHPDYKDDDGLKTESQKARNMGYVGKMAIHPRQVPIMNQAFSPTDAEIQRAQALIQAHEEQQSKGVGAFAFEGKMVDMPMIRHAEHILQRARSTGQLS